jgi:hypothetical protein
MLNKLSWTLNDSIFHENHKFKSRYFAEKKINFQRLFRILEGEYFSLSNSSFPQEISQKAAKYVMMFL